MDDTCRFCLYNNINDTNGTLNRTAVKDLLHDHLFALSFDHIGLVIIYVLMFLIGLLGNGFLSVTLFCRRRFRNITNFFLCNLAIADLAGRCKMDEKSCCFVFFGSCFL